MVNTIELNSGSWHRTKNGVCVYVRLGCHLLCVSHMNEYEQRKLHENEDVNSSSERDALLR